MLAIVSEQHLVAHPIPGGFTFTLASRLGQILAKAEAEFGPRDKSFTILGVEFRDGVPQSWFPENRGHVVVQLGLSAMQDPNRAVYQLAHECFHLLDPAPAGTNQLEEGAATLFAIDFMQSEFGVQFGTGDARYDRACDLARELRSHRSDAAKELRRVHGPLRQIVAAQIVSLCSVIDPALAQALSDPF